ncbi:CocE/NonD family hydrolase, partial [Polymorphobacter sp.]|uniref:CocE/NonD family hydrolase n=1 Tax=Polymorphobacter sp. TaxID=1909290 RepID=UPI003F6E8605
MSSSMSQIAILGLGTIGGAMVTHLIAAGYTVDGHDPDAQASARARAAGATIAATPEALAATPHPLILSLPSAEAALAVTDIIARAGTAPLVIDTSTLSLATKQQMAARLAEAGIPLLDCPISGTGAQMAARDAVVYASGDPAPLAAARPFLAAIAREVIDLGPFGNATRMKLVANHLVALHNVATAEAMLLGLKAGLDAQAIIAAIGQGAAQSRIFALRAPLVAADQYEPAQMKLGVWAKDMALLADFARSHGAATPLLDAVQPLYAAALDAGLSQADTAAVARVLAAHQNTAVPAIPAGTAVPAVPNFSLGSEIRDGMRIDWDVPITMSDGLVLRADVFRPVEDGNYPVLLTHGPYAKGLSFQQGYPSAWKTMADNHPDVTAGSSNLYQNWEVADPEKWVPHGYACVRVDSRGCGTSPGFIDHFSPRETQDFYECIEWAGVQPWSNGKVGLNGVSYFGINQWQVASLQPPHLAAMCIWEGAADFYRDMTHHGGILSTFWANWSDMQVKTVQHGIGERGRRSLVHGALVCGDTLLDDETLAANRCDFGNDIFAHPLDDDYHQVRSPDWSKVTVPFLSAANWGGQGLHTRGNFEGFTRAASPHKWLEAHGLEHWTHFYTDYGRHLQKRFFDHFLKGDTSSWQDEPPVRLQVRHLDHFEDRTEAAWPIPRTVWTKHHLDLATGMLADAPTHADPVSFAADGDGLTFLAPPCTHPTEITGPLALRLHVSSSTVDADLFAVVRVYTPDMREMVFQGAIDPHTPIAQGWLRASHRKLDPALSQPWRPYHSHDELQPLSPGEIVTLDIEIWPTSIVVPAGHRLAMTVRGKDYDYGHSGGKQSNFKNELRGCGPFLHNDPRDR